MPSLLCLVFAPALATTLDELVARGQVSLIESGPDQRLKQVTTWTRIDAPVDAVWTRLAGFQDYATWMPQVAKSEVLTRTDTEVEVSWSIKVPGPNAQFTAKYTLDPANRTVVATGTSGAVTGGTWEWRLEDRGSYTLVQRTTYASAVIDNWIVRQFDDDAHSLELGLNAASPLVELRGLKAACER